MVESQAKGSFSHALKSILILLAKTYKYKGSYQGFTDVFKALTMRAAIGRLGGKIFKPRSMTIHAKNCPTPIFLRRGTSDFQIFLWLFEEHSYDVAETIPLGSSPCIIDCGGNIGLASLRFSLFWPGAKFLVVEPDAGNVSVLRKNLAHLIGSGRCQVVEGFVGAAEGKSAIDRTGRPSEYKMAEAGTGDEVIPVYSMSNLMSAMNAPMIDLLKVDIEGAEAALFGDCQGWIARVRYLLVEIDPPYTVEALLTDLRRAGAVPKLLHQNHSEVAIALEPTTTAAA